MDVLSFSKQTKREADELLKKGGVVKVLLRYGKVVMIGSYKYDLMYGSDIDLVVVTDNPSKAAQNVLIDFVSVRNFQKYQFGDFEKHPLDNRPRSYIVVLAHEHKGRRWEIEIWFFKKFSEYKKFSEVDETLENSLMSVSSKQKEIILKLKHQREISKTSKHKLDSVTLYKGVLQRGKENIEEY